MYDHKREPREFVAETREDAVAEAARARGAEQEVRALLSEKEAQVRQLRERLRTISTELR